MHTHTQHTHSQSRTSIRRSVCGMRAYLRIAMFNYISALCVTWNSNQFTAAPMCTHLARVHGIVCYWICIFMYQHIMIYTVVIMPCGIVDALAKPEPLRRHIHHHHHHQIYTYNVCLCVFPSVPCYLSFNHRRHVHVRQRHFFFSIYILLSYLLLIGRHFKLISHNLHI